jgi:hypothetical protein
MSAVCELSDGTRVRYSLKKRDRDPCFLVCFRGRDRKRKERSTKEQNQKRAHLSALAIIKRTYSQGDDRLSWADARKLVRDKTTGHNLRSGSTAAYLSALSLLHKVFPETHGPMDISPDMAEKFKTVRGKLVAPRTVKGNLQHLQTVYAVWLEANGENPFVNVKWPKIDQKEPVLVPRDAFDLFLAWLAERWEGWRLPALFLEVQRSIGCRITELASLASDHLRDGRACFTSGTTKGRKDRACRLPAALFAELQSIAGPTYVFERFSEELRGFHARRGENEYVGRIRSYTSTRLRLWIEEQHRLYFEQTGVEHWKLHTGTRGAAMSKARMNGVLESDASIFFGCKPETMHKHYLALNREKLGDGVAEKLFEEEKSEGDLRETKRENP